MSVRAQAPPRSLARQRGRLDDRPGASSTASTAPVGTGSDESGFDETDRALVRGARQGDRDAFDAIVRRYGPDMYRYASRLLGSDADAAEAVQEAFVSAWVGIGRFEGRSALRTWLFRLVHRRAVDLQRKRRPTPVDDELFATYADPAGDDPLQQVLNARLVQAVEEALGELGESQRAVWLLREVEEMSYAEIAATLSITPDSARGLLQRARAGLSERLAAWH